jgi:hypothetical protein
MVAVIDLRCPFFTYTKSPPANLTEFPQLMVELKRFSSELPNGSRPAPPSVSRILKSERKNEIMIRLLQRVSLPSLCALVLVFIPLSAWAQSTATTQQDRTDQTGVNQTNQNVDHTQDQNQNQYQNQTDINRQKPSDTSDPNAVQNRQDANTQTNTQQNTTTDTQRSTGATTMPENKQPANRSRSEHRSDVEQKAQTDRNQTDDANRGLPATASEVPLLALTGFASLIGAFAIRVLAKTSR